MNDFRKLSRSEQRAQNKAIDGILNAPSRPQLGDRPLGRRPIRTSNFRPTTTRHIDNFRRPEGYHAASRSSGVSPVAPAARPKPSADESLLHMSLPSGKSLGSKKRFGRKEKSKSKRKHHSWRWWSFRAGLATFAVVVLLGGFLFAKGYFKLHKVFKGGGMAAALQEGVNPSLLRGEGDGRINVLLLGKGGPGHDGPDLTDTILLASIDPVNNKAALVSIPRDFWVTAPTGGSSKINAVYANAKYRAQANSKDAAGAERAGIEAAEKVITDVLGVPIHYYGMVDFKAFEQAINTVGGVTIDVPEDLVDYTMAWQNRGSPVLARKGTQTFDGKQALMYVRSRHGSARGDFDRAERQRLLIAALSHKILSAGTYTNPVKISQLLSDFGDHVSMDMGINDARRLMTIGKKIQQSNIESVDLADPVKPLLTTGSAGGQSVVLPTAGIGDYNAIQALMRSKLRDGYIAKENANITVLNGAGIPGLATAKAEELKTFGYNVGTVADAPTQEYDKTVIVDLTNGKNKYTQNYLEKRFKVKAVRKVPDTTIQPGQASFIVILGTDAQ